MTSNWENSSQSSADDRASNSEVSSEDLSQHMHTMRPNRPKQQEQQENDTSLTTTLSQLQSEPVNTPENREPEEKTQRQSWLSVWQNWQVWAAIVVLLSGGIGYTSTSLLLKLPKTPNCSQVFWPFASASMRLYCAQLQADKGDAENLLAAISLVANLPKDHPLHLQINSSTEKWATEILNIGEEKFQAGNLKEAIEIARKIPKGVEAHKLVDERLGKWQDIWSKAEETYAQVDKQLRSSNWNQAFSWAVQLTNSPNRYWATIKYQETVDNIKLAQEESAKLDVAFAQLRKGDLDNVIAAIEKAREIREESYAYQEAQKLVASAQDRLRENIDRSIANRKWSELLTIVNRLPPKLGFDEQIEDWSSLASAGSSADLGTVSGMEDAIAQAEKIDKNSPLYKTAQQLVSRWKLEIKDVAYLIKARELAQPGNINDLSAAIAQAQQIPPSNPRYQDAQKEIRDWNNQIKTIQDQPYLDRAQEIALGSNISAWQEAINQASVITSDSPLYSEARNLMSTWRDNIERVEDQPYLDRAAEIASQFDYANAINYARQIRPGRALYREAQSRIYGWQQEILGRESLDRAYRAASGQTSDALLKAIGLAQRVPSSSDVAAQSRQEIENWSSQILTIAQNVSSNSLEEAIRIAKTIPSGTSAYTSAQARIGEWQRILRPIVPTETIPLEEVNPQDSRSPASEEERR